MATTLALCRPALARAGLLVLTVALWLSPAGAGPLSFDAVNLVSDDPIGHPALITDPALHNAWGVSYNPTSPFWVSANQTGFAVLYTVNPITNAPSKVALQVTVPGFAGGTGNPTGQVFNSNAGAFNGDIFLFVSEDGTVSGWRGPLGTSAEVLVVGSAADVYKGAALATIAGHTYLYAANFHAGTIDVVKGDPAAPDLVGNFTDPNLPAGYAPFNIRTIGDKLYVTYAKQDAAKTDDVPGLGNGFVDIFNLDGSLVGRLITQGALNSPWGLALAPASFGTFAGDLLVGNFGDGRINVYDPLTGAFSGQLLTLGGDPLEIDGLWALTVGNGGSGGNLNEIYFTAGPDNEMHGLFGVLLPAASVPEPGTLMLFGSTLLAAFVFGRASSRRRDAVGANSFALRQAG
jgi:uncharacterized protein (TIGR03118 family)